MPNTTFVLKIKCKFCNCCLWGLAGVPGESIGEIGYLNCKGTKEDIFWDISFFSSSWNSLKSQMKISVQLPAWAWTDMLKGSMLWGSNDNCKFSYAGKLGQENTVTVRTDFCSVKSEFPSSISFSQFTWTLSLN